MINKKVLIVAPYPITNPQHGGQKRVRAIYEFYKTIFVEVKFVAVFHRGHYQDYEDSICLGQPDIIEQLDKNPYAGELIIGKAIDNDIHVRSHMAKLLMDYQPDIVQIEQIFPYLGLGPLLKELGMKPKLILSSQNIEYRMKEGIYKSLKLSKKISDPIVKQTEDLERDFTREADLVIAVSKDDAEAHREMGAKKCVVAPNGIQKTVATKEAIEHWQKFKVKHGIGQAATFIGSGHPPNWVGFIKMVGRDSSFLPPNAKILLGGGVSEYFKATYKFGDPKSAYTKFWANILPLGHLSEEHLTGLLAASDIMLLPITSGGGSNLKTAEAILSGKKIVATTYAFRGFEKYARLPNIYIADQPDEFRRLILKAIAADYVQRTSRQIRLAEKVQWQYCLLPIQRELKRLIKPGYKAQVKRYARGGLRRLSRHILKRNDP